MKGPLLIDDLFEGEDDVLGRRLAGALEELRPDAAEFRDGIARRIAAAGEKVPGPEAGGELHLAVPSFARRAAAFLPPILLPKSLAKLGVGEALAAKASVKFIPGVLALPLISLLMIVVTLWLGVRRFLDTNTGTQRQSEGDAKYAVAAWWRRFMLPVLVLVGVGIYGFFRAPGDGFALLFLVSTLAFLGVHGALAREGLATRREVGRQAGAALGWLLGISAQLCMGSRMLGPEHRGQWMVPIVLLGGVVACLRLSRSEDWKAKRMGRRYAVGTLLLFVIALGMHLGPLGRVTETGPSARAWVEGEADVDQVKDLAQVVASLELAGESDIDLTHVRAQIRKRLDAEYAGAGFNSLSAPAMIRLGAFGPDDYSRIRDDDSTERALAPQRKQLDARSHQPRFLARMFFEPLDLEQRTRVVDLVLADMDPTDRYANAGEVLDALHLFEGIGAGDRVGELADVAHAILPQLWVECTDARQAAFAPYKPDEPTARDLSFVWCRSTATAVQLMARFGVPEGIDLERLDAYLLEQSSHYRSGNPTYAMNAAASRALLHTLPAWRALDHSTSLFQWLVDLRVLLASLLLSGFAVLLTLRAPEEANGPVRKLP